MFYAYNLVLQETVERNKDFFRVFPFFNWYERLKFYYKQQQMIISFKSENTRDTKVIVNVRT